MGITVGIDWGNNAHAVCAVDEAGKVRLATRVEHKEEALRSLLAKLSGLGVAEEIPIAIERPSGLLVDTLLDAGHPVFPIHPNVVKASRPRYKAAQSKSDPDDAYLLADLLRTDRHRFRALQPASDRIKALRAMVRSRDDLLRHRVAMVNELEALLDSFWPGAKSLFADLESGISLAFLRRYPTPQSAARLGVHYMASFLSKNRYSGGTSPEELVRRLRAAPSGFAGAQESAVKGQLVLSYVSILESLTAQLRELTGRIEHAVEQIPTGQVLMSLPRAGKLNAAQMLAEIGEDRERFTCPEQLAAEAGVAPVTYQSGKHLRVGFRRACNKSLRHYLTTFAGNSRHDSPWAADLYAQARARGHDHPHATRIVARAWLRVFWKCWKDGVPYDPSKHNAARPYLAAA
jgi:transposase